MKFYMKHGMKVTKLHTVYQLRHSPWLLKNSNYKADRRAERKIKFNKTCYKLIYNAFYGNLKENTGKQTNLDLIDKTYTQKASIRQSKK